MRRIISTLHIFVFACTLSVQAQSQQTSYQEHSNFPHSLFGTWKGMMKIYSNGVLRDSVLVKMTIAPTSVDTAWTWRTEYLSEKLPMTKDYVLRLVDKSRNVYMTDEGDDYKLYDYLVANTLYSIFETEGVLLTARYSWQLFPNAAHDTLMFEVTSGRKENTPRPNLTNYSVRHLQRVTMKRE